MAIQTESQIKAQKVLDYWYTIEFLAQDKFDDMLDIRIKMLKAQEDFLNGNFRKKTIWSCRELKDSKSIYDIVSEDAISCGMKKWGNITIYIGKVKREACIDCIAKVLPKTQEEERPEKTFDNIAWASLQISPDGTYVEHSLSLSTILWSLNQIKNSKDSLSKSINQIQYKSTVEELETKFFSKGQIVKKSEEEKESGIPKLEEEEENIQIFAPNAVTAKLLNDLYKHIEKEFVNGNIELTVAGQEYQEVYGLYFQLFADEKIRSKMDEDNYLGLSHDYYSEDIKFVLQKIMEDPATTKGQTSDDLVRYIYALGEDDQDDKIDLVNPKEKNKFFKHVSEILEVQNAPLGKWPSKFMPAFMQQIAVNLCIKKGESELYRKNCSIFSVNGPPGTGKTTLLKEIVVSNIIERAILLTDYKDPDDAFEKQSFLHGEKKENAYSTFIRGWHRLKDDRINDYSILVTSCNNAAVENISKELPLGTSMLNDLKPAAEDSQEYTKLLNEVIKLFDVTQSQNDEMISKKSCKDVYFTEYAKNLFDNEGVWGLIAASMGKRANISTFYNQVLNPLYWDFYPNKNFKDLRIKKYAEAKDEFEKQIKIVKDLQAQLKDIGKLVGERAKLVMFGIELESKISKEGIECKKQIESDESYINQLKEISAQEVSILQSTEEKSEKLEKLISQTEQEMEIQFAKKREGLEKAAAIRNGIGILDKLFNKKKVTANDALAKDYQEDVIKAEVEVERLAKLVEEVKESQKKIEKEVYDIIRSKEQTDTKIADKMSKINELETQIQKLKNALEENKTTLANTETMYIEKVKIFTQKESVDAGLILDVKFTNSLLSQNIGESANAQVANPWFTKRYNIEREKLFYYAMKLHKEFVLSSKSCRDNFKTLGHYWGMLDGDGKEKIVFHPEDKLRFAGVLYQTLFLLVPVLSTTFASLGRFMCDVKQAGVIGTLIVDESGQAQPQMAVGALYRSRKAMIVGDPKQVEPVVMDDLNLLKRTFEDKELNPYKSKIISVQSFADNLNSFGTYLDNGTDYPEWVGCPLVVHRRCISPMYDISNEISYNGMMKQQTRKPDAKKESTFVYGNSQWINIVGKEKGNKNHFVEEQGQRVCEILEAAFSKSDDPSLYIISPFTSVVKGMKEYVKKYKKRVTNTNLSKCEPKWIDKNIGTVHTFQGKEANEVIFLLGCDKSPEARGAIRWVNANIVNVAVTRAKFRLYVIGDDEAWQNSTYINKANIILNTFAIKEIEAILSEDLPEEKQAKALAAASESLPPVSSFKVDVNEDENGNIDFSVDTSGLLQGLDESFMSTSFSKEQLGKFGFQSMEDFNEFRPEVQKNLLIGMKLYYLLSPVYKVNNKLDASCCAILFCKVIELQMKDCFLENLKANFPNQKIRGRVELKDAEAKEFTLGTFHRLLKDKRTELGIKMVDKGKKEYGFPWWETFVTRLSECTNRRNRCCHSGLFTWEDQMSLLDIIFMSDDSNKVVPMKGILFESRIGKSI